MEKRPDPLTIFSAFFRLGLTAFGGPAMVKYIRELCCKRHRWVSEEDFEHGIALVQTIPGATAMQAAAYAGLRAGGGMGALAAYTGFSLPAFFLILFLTVAYERALDIHWVSSCFSGLKVVVVAIVGNAAISFGKKLIRSWKEALLATGAALLFILKQNPIFIIGACGVAAIYLFRKGDVSKGQNTDAHASVKGRGSNSPVRDNMGLALKLLLASLFILMLVYLFQPEVFKLSLVMMKVDFFAYGGGYASLPLMLHEIVDKMRLMDQGTFMDGIALGQITPGPIVITAAFVGFLLYGLSGAVICTWAVFTPSLLILLVTDGFFTKFRSHPLFRKVMRGILASFVGLLLAVFVNFFMAVEWTYVKGVIGLGASAALFYGIDILYVVLIAGGVSALLI